MNFERICCRPYGLTKAPLLTLVLFLSSYLYGQSDDVTSLNKRSITVSKINPIYKKGEPISFVITNNLRHEIWVSTSLLYYRWKDGWEEMIPDISNYNCDLREKFGIVYAKLESKDTLIVWDPKLADSSSCFAWRSNVGKYRFNIKVATEQNVQWEISTRPFKIQ